MKELKRYLLVNWRQSILLCFILLFQATGTLMIPFLIARLIDQGILNTDINSTYAIGLQMGVVALLTAVIGLFGSYLSAKLAVDFGNKLRMKVFKKTLSLSLENFNRFETTSLLNRATTDISIIQGALMKMIQLIIPAPLITIAAIFFIAQNSIVLAIVLSGLILIFFIFVSIILTKSANMALKIQSGMDQIAKILRESITGIRVIRAFNRSDFEEERNNDSSSSYANKMISVNKLFALLNPSVWLIMGLAMIAVIWFGGLATLQGKMEIGGIVAVTEYSIIVLSYMIIAATSFVTVPKMLNCLKRIQEILEITYSKKNNSEQLMDTKKSSLVFKNVSFSYNHGEKVLDNISFESKTGEVTAIIGSTGAGKSTLANLVLGLYEVDHGQILVNGQDIRNISKHSLRDHIGYIPQKSFLFSGSIQSNLNMGKPNATSTEIMRSLDIAQVKTFVNHLPMKLKTPVSQTGKNFSGGQKQRLTIARAIVKKPDVYIFDDSFSALDYSTEKKLRDALKESLGNSTMLVIAQRISTIINAEQIVVLDQGKIVGIGTHGELLATCKTYQEIAKSQLDMEVTIDD